jgi:hypothetical protein
MKKHPLTRQGLRRGLLAVSIALACGLQAGNALAGDEINPDADQILRAMSDYLAGMQSFTVDADVSNEVLTVEGQKLQLNSFSTVAIDRPARFQISRKGRFADATLSYDGAQMTLHGKGLNAYMQKPFAGTIDDALRDFERSTGLALPGVDLLLINPYEVLTRDVISSGYYGTAWIGDVEVHHLAFRTPKIDFQVWVDTGEHPLPRKYVITTKWTTGAPQYSVQLSNWNGCAVFGAEDFEFSPPEGAIKLDAIPVDATGEVVVSEEKK